MATSPTVFYDPNNPGSLRKFNAFDKLNRTARPSSPTTSTAGVARPPLFSSSTFSTANPFSGGSGNNRDDRLPSLGSIIAPDGTRVSQGGGEGVFGFNVGGQGSETSNELTQFDQLLEGFQGRQQNRQRQFRDRIGNVNSDTRRNRMRRRFRGDQKQRERNFTDRLKDRSGLTDRVRNLDPNGNASLLDRLSGSNPFQGGRELRPLGF